MDLTLDGETGRAAARDVRGIPPIAFRLHEGSSIRFTPAGDRIAVDAVPEAPTTIALSVRAWRDFLDETLTAPGLLYGGHLTFECGAYAALERWEPALRALASRRPIFDPDRVRLTAVDGRPLDVRRSFAWADDDATLANFLRQAGYLHVRSVFSAQEVARLREAVERRAALARPGDGRSWWATRSGGERVLCRLVYLGAGEPAIAQLSEHPRLVRLLALAGSPLRAVEDRADGHSVVFKPSGVVEGLADLPWHRDCGLGGHPFTCPALNIGIQLDAATAATGQLHFVPGSAGTSCHRSDLARTQTVAIDTEPGDCTVHLGDVMHAAPPPTGAGPGRRALYVSGMPPRAFEVIPAGKSYNDVILRRVGG